ncbi:LysR family transcriptional regulator [Alphaproteobacteria bacterium]|nr:LysR family transcriptional regulator [Alphaproteobacteria bacterium]
MKYLTSLNYLNEISKQGSIRKAAEKLNITSTALNRRLIALEEDIGAEIFERLPRGVRLNTAGELLINQIRKQIVEIERIKSQIADLSGQRRGNVNKLEETAL